MISSPQDAIFAKMEVLPVSEFEDELETRKCTADSRRDFAGLTAAYDRKTKFEREPYPHWAENLCNSLADPVKFKEAFPEIEVLGNA